MMDCDVMSRGMGRGRTSQDADEVAQVVAVDGADVVQAQLLEQRRPGAGDQTTCIPGAR